jgi:hypothetical protein
VCYISLGTRIIEEPERRNTHGARKRGKGRGAIHHGARKKEEEAEEGEGLQPPATTRPALPPPPGRHCRWAHPGTAAPLTPALPAQPAEDAMKTRAGTAAPCTPALPASPELTSSRPFICHLWTRILSVMPLMPLDGSGPIYTSLPTSFRVRQDDSLNMDMSFVSLGFHPSVIKATLVVDLDL